MVNKDDQPLIASIYDMMNEADIVIAHNGDKFDTGGFELWARCMDNDIAAFEEMLEYNIYDVVLLEGLYQRIAPWYSTHVNVTN